MKTVIAVLAIAAGALVPTQSSAQMPTSQVILENQSIRVTLLTFAPDRGLSRAIVARAAYTIDPNRNRTGAASDRHYFINPGSHSDSAGM